MELSYIFNKMVLRMCKKYFEREFKGLSHLLNSRTKSYAWWYNLEIASAYRITRCDRRLPNNL